MTRSTLPMALVCLLWACDDKETQDTAPVLAGPSLEHVPPEGTFVEGDVVSLVVGATDEDGVSGVRLFWRIQGDSSWSWTDMTAAGSDWAAEVVGDAPGVEYYFRGVDSGDPAATSYLPEDFSNAPFSVPVLVASAGLPFVEDFELDEQVPSLEAMGWVSYSQDFQGYPWALATPGGVDDSTFIRHTEGYGDPDQAMVDWLISPALDFTTEARIQVSWWQAGKDVELADHALYVSTGSRVPEDGDYVLAASPAISSTAWTRSEVVDLSDWTGEPVVYLAWVYTGANTDAWYVDDIAVESLHADLAASLAWTPDPVHPGETAGLVVTVRNAAEADATGVVATLEASSGGGTFDAPSVEVGALAAGASVDVPFAFHVDPSWPDNSYLPLTLTLDDGTRTWVAPLQLTVGYASTATVTFTADEEALVEVTVGVGDPDAPTWEAEVFTGSVAAGASTFSLDVTDQGALLPPEAGEHRWFSRITPFTDGTVDAFTVSYGGVEYTSDLLPALASGEEVLVYVPPPPAPVLEDWATFPFDVAPGDARVVFTSIDLGNDGSPFDGVISASLRSDDPDVIVDDPGPVSAGNRILEDLGGVFAFTVSATHLDSTPVDLELVLQDEAESFVLPLSVPVPWPVPKISRVEVDDGATGDGDGMLDPGEQATLEIEVINAGDLDCDGVVRGTLTVAGDSAVAATILSDEESFGAISAGSARDEDFDLVVDGGAVGDLLVLELVLTDDLRSFTARTELTLGEPVWTTVSTLDDEVGDMLSGGGFDFVNGRYRVVDGLFQLRLESAVPYDAATLFIEAWGAPAGAAGYDLYRLVLQSGLSELQGYTGASSSFTDLAEPVVTWPSATEVQLEWDVAGMSLSTDAFTMGFGAGWCGPPDYYCDHFPDGWGYPYEGYYSGDWFTLRW